MLFSIVINVGCSSEKVNHASVLEIDGTVISDEHGFYNVYARFKKSLSEKDWVGLYYFLRKEEKKYFPTASKFEEYLNKNAKSWNLKLLNELSSNITLYDESNEKQMTVEVYFYAEILPGSTRHHGSLKFDKNKEGNWSLLNWEMLRLPMVQFQDDPGT